VRAVSSFCSLNRCIRSPHSKCALLYQHPKSYSLKGLLLLRALKLVDNGVENRYRTTVEIFSMLLLTMRRCTDERERGGERLESECAARSRRVCKLFDCVIKRNAIYNLVEHTDQVLYAIEVYIYVSAIQNKY